MHNTNNTRVLLNAYKWPPISKKIIKAVIKHLKNGSLGEYEEDTGPLVNFEKKFAKYIGSKYALLCSSGTSALFSAYFSIRLQPGDEVLVPAFTFVATVSPLLFFGVKIVFVECEEGNGNIDPTDLAKKISQKTKAVVITHNGGIPVDIDPILKLKDKFSFFLIEDCARALGSEYKHERVGKFGDVSCFSFQEKKVVFGGEGGIALTSDRGIYERMVLLGHYFRSKTKTHLSLSKNVIFSATSLGLNFSIHPLSAIIANESFNFLESTISNRAHSYKEFKSALLKRRVKSIKLTRIPNYCTKISHYHYVTKYNSSILPMISKKVFVSELRKRGVDARITDHKPLYRFPLFQKEGKLMFGRLGNNCTQPSPSYGTPSDRFFDSMIVFPPITKKGIIQEYVKIISEVEKNLHAYHKDF